MPKRSFARFVLRIATIVITVLLLGSTFLAGIVQGFIANRLPKGFNAPLVLLGLFIICCVLTILSITVHKRVNQTSEQNRAAMPPPEQDRYLRQRLISKVRRFWIEDYFSPSLYHTCPLRPVLFSFPRGMNHPQVFQLERSLRLSSGVAIHDIVEIYDHAHEGLLIIGEAGCGKTTQLLLLTNHLLEKAASMLDAHQHQEFLPIPVIFPLSSWAKTEQNLAEWLVSRLEKDYQFPPHISKSWIENGTIQPFLDGLDEVDPKDQEACIQQINLYRQSHGLVPIVVSCRTDHYVLQKVSLLLESVVEIQPLTPLAIDLYLFQASQQPSGEPLAKLKQAMQKDVILRELLSTPLMLEIGVKAYLASQSTRSWFEGTIEERRNSIFSTYIEQVLAHRTLPHYSPKQTISWLAWLADQMHHRSETIFYSERIEPDWFPQSPRSWWRLSPLMGSNLLLIFSLLLLALIFHNTLAYVLTGIGVWVLPLHASDIFDDLRIIEPPRGIWKEVQKSLLSSVFVGLIVSGLSSLVGLIISTVTPIVWSQGTNVMIGLYSWLFYGLIFGNGTAWIKYASVRFCLWRDGYKPFNYPGFLRDAKDCCLLSKVGKGYMFPHPLFLVYFASLNTAPITDWRDIDHWEYKISGTSRESLYRSIYGENLSE